MDLKTRMDIILENYNHIGRMKMTFKELSTPYLNNNDLSAFGVQLSQMSLHPEDTVDSSGPHFCKPFPAHEFDRLFEKINPKQGWDQPAPDINGNFHEGHGLERWF